MHNRGVARDTCPVALQRRERDAKHLGSFALVQAGEISELDHPTGAWIDSGVHPTNQALVDTAKLHQGDGDVRVRRAELRRMESACSRLAKRGCGPTFSPAEIAHRTIFKHCSDSVAHTLLTR
jgi:hypothetical protein